MATVDEIKGRLDILDIVSRYAPMQQSGRSYKALCPFHTEKTPSFYVFPDRQSWRCFGACATGGDMFSFLMRMENLDFGEALRRLADQAGVKLEERRGRKNKEDPLYLINEATMELFHSQLASGKSGSAARAYLKNRGLTQETVDRFQLGLSPADGESLKDHLSSKGYTLEQLALAGVVTQGQSGSYRDLFRGRLMFPIRDADGMLAGFGGRSLDDSTPKYLNTPRSPVFDKSHILYALPFAKDGIREGGIVIVEGYMDAIAAHQHGFSNVVASMGTALTQQQVSLVRGLVRRPGAPTSGEVILALDPDTAGQEATLRSLESSWRVFQTLPVGQAQGATLYKSTDLPSLKVAPLPQGKDPAEVIMGGPQEWAKLTEGAVPLLDYLFTALSHRIDLTAPQGKARLAELLFPLIAATPDHFQQDYHFQHLAALLGVSEATLEASLGRPRQRRQPNRTRGARPGGDRPGRAGRDGQEATATPFATLDHDPLEEYCLALVLQNPEFGRLPGESGVPQHEEALSPDPGEGADGLRPEYFFRVENREVFTNWMKCSKLDGLRESLDEELGGHLDYLLAKALPPADRKQREDDLRYGVRRLEERYLRELNREEQVRLAEADPDQRADQERRIIQLSERLNQIFNG